MNIAQRFGWWFFAAVLAIFCFWPSLTVEFGVHNDYSIWSYDRTLSGMRHLEMTHLHPESAHLVAIGRPLGAALLNMHLYPIRTVADYTTARWFTLLVILLSAMLLARHLRHRVHLPTGFAVCAAMCVFLLPPSQAFLFWVGNFVPGSLNVLFALLTYEVLDKVQLSGWRGGPGPRAKFVAWLVLAGFLFLCSMCVYPATTLFILVPTFCSVVFSPLEIWPQTRRVVLRDGLFAIAGVGEYFLLTRFVIRPVLGHNFPAVQNAIDWNQAGLYQLTVERNVLVWLENFWSVLSVSLGGSLHPLLSYSAEPKVAWALAASLLVVGVWWFLRKPAVLPTPLPAIAPGGRRGYFLQASLAGLALMVLSECPIILPAGAAGFVPYRVVYPASAMILLLLLSIVGRLRLPFAANVPAFIATPVPALALVACAILGNMNLGNAATNAHTELAFFREQLRSLDLRATNGLLVIGPIPGFNFVEGPLRAEFKIPATSSPFVAGFADALLEEKGIRRGEVVVRHQLLDPTAEYSMAIAGTAVIDMNLARQGPQYPKRPRALVSVSTESGGNALSAFDHDSRSFWEAGGQNQWVQVDYGQPYQVAEYSFCASHPPDRTPLDWQLLGSNDGSHWTLLDQRHGEKVWALQEVRTFSLAKPVQFSAYKVLFTARRSEVVRISEVLLGHESSIRIATHPKASPQ